MAKFGEIDNEKVAFQREWYDWARSENIEGMTVALAEGQDINEIVLEGLTAASIAGLESKPRLFDFLRENGADFNALDGNDMNALMCAASSGNVKIAAKILARGNPETHLSLVSSKNQTPLHFAALSGRAEMVQFLISKGAAVNALDVDANTPLHLSMKGNSPLAVTILLNSGADANLENAKNQIPAKFSGGNAACRQALDAAGASSSSHFGGLRSL